MARLTSQHRPMEVLAPAPATTLILGWTISRAAASACGLVRDEAGAPVRLEVLVSAPHAGSTNIEARLVDGDRRIPLESSPRCGTWIEDSIRGVWHLDIDTLLKLTVRSSGAGFEALYARTSLLANAGLAGGRYEFDGASIAGDGSPSA